MVFVSCSFRDFVTWGGDAVQRDLRKSLFLIAVLAGVSLAPVVRATELPKGEPGKDPARVGTYDSRFVAMADCGSEQFEARVRRLDEALKKAKEQGNAEAIKKADRAVWEYRHLTHRQGFGDWPVDDILKEYPEAVEQVKKEAQVDVLVSKWDKETLAKHKTAATVDVTERLINAMKPKEARRLKVLEWLKQANAKGGKPLGPEELEKVLKAEAGEHYLPPPARTKATEPKATEPETTEPRP
jgi:hypothetical protein